MSRFERFKYRNHLGEELEFGKVGLFVDVNDLRDYAWEVSARGNKISRFSRGITQKTIPVAVAFKNKAYVTEMKNKLFEFCEKDVIAKQYGRIIIGDYYFKCYVTASAKSSYAHDPCFTQFNIELTTDEPYWIKEHSFAFRKLSDVEGAENLEYPYDYSYDYFSGSGAQRLLNSYFAPVDFKMVIYGSAVNPTITIGGHQYKVNVTVQSGEYLTIDSEAKTIVLTKNDGEKVSKFDDRDRSSYIFEPIPAGSQSVLWLGDFGVDITLIEKRSEPKWI